MRHLTGGRHAPESPGPHLGASFYVGLGANGPLDWLESPSGAFLGVDPARFPALGFWESIIRLVLTLAFGKNINARNQDFPTGC